MNSKRWVSSVTAIFGLVLMIGPFQNCAPPEQMPLDPNSEVRVSDDWSNKKVAFFEESVVVEEQTVSVDLLGMCSRKSDGSIIYWELIGKDNSAIDMGESVCEKGGFSFEVVGLEMFDCGHKYSVIVSSDAGDDDVMTLTKDCQL